MFTINIKRIPGNHNVMVAAAALLLGLLLCASCGYSYKIMANPADAELFINSERVSAGKQYAAGGNILSIAAHREGYREYSATITLKDLFSPQEITVDLEKKAYNVEIRLAGARAECVIDDESMGNTPFKGRLEYGTHKISFRRKGLPEQQALIDVKKDDAFLFRSQPEDLPVRQVGIFPCGSAPKQLNFSPDNRLLFIALLDGEGFQIFDMENRGMNGLVKVGPRSKLKGFPEGLFIEGAGTYLISQMNTDKVFEYKLAADGTVTPARTFETGGIFCKFMAYSPPLDLLAVSNWCSNDVSLINYGTGKLSRLLKGISTPRGVEFTQDGKHLFVASFEDGGFYKYSTDTWKREAVFSQKNAAMRHIALTKDETRIFVSDMYHFVIYELDAADLSLLHTYKAYYNPNTIALDSADRYLFVSCRGPNNPKGYTLRSPQNGRVMVFDVKNRTLAFTIQGGNQPTGLDISGDDRYLVFSNFMDANFEVYDLAGLYNAE
jgi:6-phosphogluconolactonase (cycloisomerase 2 family)